MSQSKKVTAEFKLAVRNTITIAIDFLFRLRYYCHYFYLNNVLETHMFQFINHDVRLIVKSKEWLKLKSTQNCS